MPCRYETEADELRGANATLNNHTQMLCEACALIKAQGLEHRMSLDLRTWWNAHEAEDRDRRYAELCEQTREHTRTATLRKMSRDEAAALGLVRDWDRVHS